MRFQLASAVTVVSAALAIASPAWHGERALHLRNDDVAPRPVVTCSPHHPRLPTPFHPPRGRVCPVKCNANGQDDAPNVLAAVRQCNGDGRIVFEESCNYTIGTALNLSTLHHVDLDIQGHIQFTNNTAYWQANSFKFVFQNSSSFWIIGGEDVAIYGGGTIDGNGQVWYDLYAQNIYIFRPILMGIVGLHDSTISNLNLRYSPMWYHIVANSTNVIFDNINIAGASKSVNPAKNTDGWDTYRSSDITIQNSHINNGDDCVAFKPNSTNLLIQNLFCNGSHGISVGSLGQYVGEYDIVENVYVFNASMHNTTDGARIKVWPNSPSAVSGDLQGGGGSGRVNNVTYDTMLIDNVDYAIEVDQCYGQSNLTLCDQYPSHLTISNILFKNFNGKTSKKYQPEIATFACSSSTVCSAITASSINVLSPNGSDLAYCQNVNPATLDVTCTSGYKGFN